MTESVNEKYDYPYTDRDVREDDRLRQMALGYLNVYGGNFEPLVEAQRYLVDHEMAEMPTVMVRKVLNCMRHDFKVADTLPIPVRAKVIPMAPKRRRNRNTEDNCENAEPHDPHYSSKTNYCHGVPWPLTRESHILFPAHFPIELYPFVMSRTGKLIHRIQDVPENGSILWGLEGGYESRHRYGPRCIVQHNIFVECKTSIIHMGILLTTDRAAEIESVGLHSECKSCFNEGDLRF